MEFGLGKEDVLCGCGVKYSVEADDGVLSILLSSSPEKFEEDTLDPGEKENVDEEAEEGVSFFFLPLLRWNLANFSVHFFPLDKGDRVFGFSSSIFCLGVFEDVLYWVESPKL